MHLPIHSNIRSDLLDPILYLWLALKLFWEAVYIIHFLSIPLAIASDSREAVAISITAWPRKGDGVPVGWGWQGRRCSKILPEAFAKPKDIGGFTSTTKMPLKQGRSENKSSREDSDGVQEKLCACLCVWGSPSQGTHLAASICFIYLAESPCESLYLSHCNRELILPCTDWLSLIRNA